MPNIKSAKKRVKVNATKAAANKSRKSNLKTILKKADLACTTGAADKEEAIKTAINTARKTALKTAIKKFEAAVAESDKAAATVLFNDAVKKLDQGVAHGILHKNKAARKKSQLAKKLNAAG